MSTPYQTPIPLGSKLGAAFLGNLIAGMQVFPFGFYGITCVQMYVYFNSRSANDRRWFKWIIAFLWVLDTVQLAMVTHGLYYFMISNFGNFVALLATPWSLPGQIFVTIVSDLIVRCIFGRRVWIMTRRNYIILVLIGLTSLLAFVTGLIYATKTLIVREFALFDTFSLYLYLALGGGVACDLLIASSLCFTLSKRRTGFKKTDSMVNILMMYAINTSLLTTICSAACFITYSIWPDEFTFMGIYFSLSKLFLNSLLATLNGREGLTEKLKGASQAISQQLSRSLNLDSGGEYPATKTSPGGRRGPSVIVNINREIVNHYEMESPVKSPTSLYSTEK